MVQRRRRTEGKRRVYVPLDSNIFTQIPRQYIYRLGIALGVIIILYMIYPGDEPEIVEEEVTLEPISVEVLNGCGVSGVAAQMTEYLRLNDIDVLITDDADNSSYPETIIIGRDLQFDYTEIISQLTGIDNRTVDNVTESTVNITIIIGKDYKNFKPFKN